MKLIDKNALATDVLVRDVTPETVHTDPAAYARLGWIIVVVAVVGSLVWATFAPLDKGAPLSGFVAKESNRKAIQHLTGGIVEDILVKDGQLVKKGQVLVRMNGVNVKAQRDITLAQFFNSRSISARLLAERDNLDSISFPADLKPYKNDPRVVEAMAVQSQLFSARKEALRSELAAMDNALTGIKAQMAGQEATRDSKKEQMALLKEQLDNMRDLAKDGYVPRARLLELERTYAQTSGALAEDIGNIGRAKGQIAELNMKRLQRLAEFQRDVRAQLAEAQKDGDAAAARMEADAYAVENIDVKAPVDGVVMGVNVFTRGGVVQPGFRMMDIVPSEDALIVEGQLPINLVDKVHPGLKVELIFSAFNQSKTPHIPGEVTLVSADRFTDEHNGMPYYKVSARVTPEGMKMMQKEKLEVRPGMPVELFVKTGERTMMNYLLKPVMDRAGTALRED